ncbi:hypothetical protein G9U52_38670 [Paenibacillus sp. S3N08]|uniref:Transposase n=2 Tax=Paenibacillus agricola TaxID=2716264 RepID=A0ABX0JMD2_9BACL|nr:hypothetical protein [Paenibacillus agricola]
MQLSASGKRFVRAYAHEKQKAFLDGFARAFHYFGGVPALGLLDNLKSAVVKVLEGRDRLEQRNNRFPENWRKKTSPNGFNYHLLEFIELSLCH